MYIYMYIYALALVGLRCDSVRMNLEQYNLVASSWGRLEVYQNKGVWRKLYNFRQIN